jgi:myo-inositol-hexaphosphate 3-phosphohydrolase
MRLTIKLAFIFLFFSLLLFGFNRDPGQTITKAAAELQAPGVTAQAVKTGTLSKKIRESSGLEETGSPGVFFTHNDAGNPAELYKIDAKGKVLATLPVAGAENVDWEDITRDNQGNIYIADTGDNDNKRKHLRIYKLDHGDPENVSQINFVYGDSKTSTTGKASYEFDCEAIFWHRSRLYLVTKDRDKGVDARIYELADTAGDHVAKLISHYPVNAPVTAADMSPDGKRLMLLSVGKIHLFQVEGTNFFGSRMVTKSLGKVGQTEGAVFTSNHTLMITSEKGGLYRYEL